MRLWLDTETRSAVPISRGVCKYATGVRVLTFQYAIDEDPVTVIDLTRTYPSVEFLATLSRIDEFWAHNAEFDRTVLETTSWWPKVALARWRCTAALARMHGLPGKLSKLCEIFKLPLAEAKDVRGTSYIDLFCKPNKKDGCYSDSHSHPAEWASFLEYGKQDVIAMRAVYHKTPHWNSTPRMWNFWHLDQKINDRGVAMDLELSAGAVTATKRATRRMKDKVSDMTLGVVESATQRVRLLNYLADFGVVLPNLKATTVAIALEDERLPEYLKELLRIRQQAVKASTAKYQRILDQEVNGRLHNLLVFCGAQRTGRWAGRTIQPQNLPRPRHPAWELELSYAMFKTGTIEIYNPDEVMALASSCLRGVIVAAPKRKLVVSDLANIEGRVMAWVAGEKWKLAMFAAFDSGQGPDPYKVSYGRTFKVDPSTIGDADPRRQIGKVMELALQYYGGVGAFCAMADTYNLDLEELAASARSSLSHKTVEEATVLYAKALKRNRVYGLAKEVYIVCSALVLLWRAAHPAIVSFWYALDTKVKLAVRTPDIQYTVGEVSIDRRGNWLRICLPSGRYLCYPAPKIDDEARSTSFVGVNAFTKQWERISTYSGKIAENIVQAIAADVLMDGLLAAEIMGYHPVLSVHDEVIAEAPNQETHTDKGLSHCLVNSSPWAIELPLAAKGFTAQRYRK